MMNKKNLDEKVRVTLMIKNETKEKLIYLADGERKIGKKIDDIVREEYEKMTISLYELNKRMIKLEAAIEKLNDEFLEKTLE